MIIENKKPDDIFNRLEKEQVVYSLLEELNIDYLRADHPAAMTMEICSQISDELSADICKNLFLCNRQQTEFFLLLTPGEKRFKTKNLSSQIGSSRLSFASEEKMKEYLNLTPGSASVFGLMFDTEKKVQLIIDQDVLDKEYVGFHPNINTSSVKIKTQDLTGKILPHLNREFKTVILPGEE